MNEPHSHFDVVVIGGGLAGLAAAVKLGRAGRRVAVVERRAHLGGRASTLVRDGFALNEGPHAVYEGRAGRRVLDSLGIVARGKQPTANGGLALFGGAVHTLPGGPVSLLSTGLLDLGGKLEAARMLGGIPMHDPAKWRGIPFSEFLERNCSRPMVRALVATLGCVATYCAEPEVLDAEIALEQMQAALGPGVTYVDGGWVTIVDGLEKAAREAGVTFFVGDGAASIEHRDSVTGVRLKSGERLGADAVILAGGPAVAAALAPVASLERAAESVPSRAACVDLAVRNLPFPKRRLALGVDAPFYYSLHSAFAKLAPEGGAVVHMMKYLRNGERGDEAISELDALFARLQPGAEIVVRRALPSMVVAHARVEASRGGVHGRPDVEVPEVRGLYVAGDWVGPEGMLSDASLASAERAAERVMRVLSSRLSPSRAA